MTDPSYFFKKILNYSPEDLAREWIESDIIHAFKDSKSYSDYLTIISKDYPKSQSVSITGSGNWCYSLNPYKNFSKFHKNSDIDVSIISEDYFHEIWEELRIYHRENFYIIGKLKKNDLNRNGQNVYSGFVTPKWIPNRKSKIRFQYEINADKYSNSKVSFRAVSMMFFKNKEELIDYYIRGIRLAKVRLKQNGI